MPRMDAIARAGRRRCRAPPARRACALAAKGRRPRTAARACASPMPRGSPLPAPRMRGPAAPPRATGAAARRGQERRGPGAPRPCRHGPLLRALPL